MEENKGTNERTNERKKERKKETIYAYNKEKSHGLEQMNEAKKE